MIFGIILLLILTSACFSGLTIGMFSISLDTLHRKIKLGSKEAEKIYAVRKNGNYLLCTLLLGNVAVNSGIALLMAEVASGFIAGLVTTGMIFLFGEVTPQALFSKHAFKVGAKTTWLVKIFMVLMWPVAKPLSMALDFIFGKELAENYDKSDLEVLIEDHSESIDSDEKRIMIGAMNYSDKSALDVITPVNVVFAFESSAILDEDLLQKIKREHYSRIPIYEGNRDNVIGILFAKDLVGYDPEDKKTVKDMCIQTALIQVAEDYQLDSLLNLFLKSKNHMAFIYNQFNSLTGIVTMEDIIETILDVQILDERDTVSDLQRLAKRFNKVNLTTEEVSID